MLALSRSRLPAHRPTGAVGTGASQGSPSPGDLLERLVVLLLNRKSLKWLCAPKGSGFLWATPELQERLKSLVVGWGYGDDSSFLTRNERQGTRDPAAYLATPAAIRWVDRNGEPGRCRALAAECARRVGELTGLPAIEPHAQMIACGLPPCDADDLQRRQWCMRVIQIR